MPEKSYDVIIVGGGPGGLNLGALLAHAGRKVLVLERGGEESLGGRAVSGTVDGAAVDNGIKGLIMVGSQDEVYRRIGKQMPDNVCEWTNSGELYLDGKWHKLDDMIKRSFEEFIRVYKRGAIDMTYEEVEALDDISIEKYVTDMTDDKDVINFFRYLGWLFGGTRPVPTDYSAGSLFYSIKKQVEANGQMPSQSYWAKGGSGAIATGLIEAINEKGGEIRTGTNVSRVVIEEGRVKGVEIEEGERVVPLQLLDTRFIEAPVVASAVSIWDFLSIVSEDDLPPWYVERIRFLQHQTLNLGTVTYAMDDEELWDHSGQRWVQEGPVSGRPWCASSLRYAGEKSRYQVSFWLQTGWWEKPNYWELHKASHKAALKKLFEDWEADIEMLFPKVVKNALWLVRSFGPAAIIETPGNVGSKLVDIEAEGVEGLYLVGDRTSVAKVTGVYGTAMAALAACDLILKNKPK